MFHVEQFAERERQISRRKLKKMNINYEIANAVSGKELQEETTTVINGLTMAVNGYYEVGRALENINVNQLWKQGGFDSFPDYAGKVLGISKATAYRIIAVCKKFLKPEIAVLPADKIFSPFQDTALAALNPIGDYETTAEFIHEYDITPNTPVSKIRQIVSDYQKEIKSEVENEEEGENESENEEETENEVELQLILNKISELSFEILSENEKSPSKRKKTPIKNLNKEIDMLKTLLKC